MLCNCLRATKNERSREELMKKGGWEERKGADAEPHSSFLIATWVLHLVHSESLFSHRSFILVHSSHLTTLFFSALSSFLFLILRTHFYTFQLHYF